MDIKKLFDLERENVIKLFKFHYVDVGLFRKENPRVIGYGDKSVMFQNKKQYNLFLLFTNRAFKYLKEDLENYIFNRVNGRKNGKLGRYRPLSKQFKGYLYDGVIHIPVVDIIGGHDDVIFDDEKNIETYRLYNQYLPVYGLTKSEYFRKCSEVFDVYFDLARKRDDTSNLGFKVLTPETARRLYTKKPVRRFIVSTPTPPSSQIVHSQYAPGFNPVSSQTSTLVPTLVDSQSQNVAVVNSGSSLSGSDFVIPWSSRHLEFPSQPIDVQEIVVGQPMDVVYTPKKILGKRSNLSQKIVGLGPRKVYISSGSENDLVVTPSPNAIVYNITPRDIDVPQRISTDEINALNMVRIPGDVMPYLSGSEVGSVRTPIIEEIDMPEGIGNNNEIVVDEIGNNGNGVVSIRSSMKRPYSPDEEVVWESSPKDNWGDVSNSQIIRYHPSILSMMNPVKKTRYSVD